MTAARLSSWEMVMVPLRSFSEVKNDLVQSVVREALRNDADPELVSQFVADVDWSGRDNEPMRMLLANLEGWTADYAEGWMSKSQYVSNLLSVLPVSERTAV